MQIIKFSLSLMMLFVSVFVWAHGENKKGPHGGFIRMPGAFHTEIKQKNSNSVEIFLLDMNWKNPTVQNSEVFAELKKKNGKNLSLTCKTGSKSFVCSLPGSKSLQTGDVISVQSKRDRAVGAKVSYSIPLSLLSEARGAKHEH